MKTTDGTIDITAVGGTTPYTYLWSNGATTADVSSLAAGTYTVTVTDSHGSTASENWTITQPEPLTVSGVSTNETCNEDNDGTIDITAVGGTTPYTYLWSNGATTADISGLAAGTFTVTVTDSHGCTTTKNFSRVTGYASDEVVGPNQSIVSNHSMPREFYQGLWQTISHGEPWSGRLINRRKDGSKYLAELSISPVANAGGEILNYLGMHRDITELHRLESQVRNQKALIESVVDAAPMVIALLDVDDRVVLDNHEYKKLQADLGMAEPAPMLMSAVRASLEVDSGRSRRTSGYLFLHREVRLDPPGGRSPRWFSCSGSRVREDDTSTDAFLAGPGHDYLLLVAKEITSLRTQQEKVRVAALQVLIMHTPRQAR